MSNKTIFSRAVKFQLSLRRFHTGKLNAVYRKALGHYIFSIVILFYSSNSAAQTKSRNASIMQTQSTISLDEQWELEANVWSYAHAQPMKNNKLRIGFDAIQNWKCISGDVSMSRNGKYFAYEIHKYPRSRQLDTLVVEALDHSWRQSFTGAIRERFRYKGTPGGSTGIFSPDSKRYIYLDKSEGLCLLHLGFNEREYIKEVISVLPANDSNEWLVCQLKDRHVLLINLVSGERFQFNDVAKYDFDATSQWLICEQGSKSRDLLFFNLMSRKERRFSSVGDFKIDAYGKVLLAKIVNESGNTSLKYFDLPSGDVNEIWPFTGKREMISSFQMDDSGKQVVFVIQDTVNGIDKQVDAFICYWRVGMNKFEIVVNKCNAEIANALKIQGTAGFTDNGHYIQFTLSSQSNENGSSGSLKNKNLLIAKLDVWSYKDSAMPRQTITHNDKQAIFDIEMRKLVFVTKGQEKITVWGDYGIITESGADVYGDRFWENNYNKTIFSVVSLKNGIRKRLGNITTWSSFKFSRSPGGKYLVYYDLDKENYFSYEFATEKLTNISVGIPKGQLGWKYSKYKGPTKPLQNLGIAAWVENDKGVIVYDDYDLWRLDMSGEKLPINITNEYGRAHKILFALMGCDRGDNNPSQLPIKENDTLLLRAFNDQSKYNGFYLKVLRTEGNPELLSMEPCSTDKLQSEEPQFKKSGINPMKAAESNIWIVKRQTAVDAPNYFTTTNFKTYTRLTNFQPQREYNWLTTELHTFRHLDGYTGQGLLYKPENFDPTKKYPVLIIFYGQYSDGLYQYPIPDLNWSPMAPALSPSFFLNNGYLVFVPDIYVRPLKYGSEALTVIDGAAKYLKQLPYVDGNVGAASHSWGAKLAAYLYTHSKELSGIVISEGFLYANPINTALSNGEDGVSKLQEVEKGFEYGNLWKNKSRWLDQTAVLNVDKAKMPLLLYCGKKSSSEYQDQTTQLFTAARRLELKAWWLNYDNGDHTLDGNDAKDITIRFTQFFDHYLKGAPAPSWMTQGLPNRINGKEDRLELDPANSCAMEGKNYCYVCEAWNKQYKRTAAMFEKEIKYWQLDKDIKDELDRKTKAARARLDKEQEVEDNKTVSILKYGYPETEKKKREVAKKK